MRTFWGIAGILALAACTPPIPVTITEVGPVEFQWAITALDIDDSGRILVQEGSAPAVVQPNGEVVRFPLPAGYINCIAVKIANDGTVVGECRGKPSNPRLASPFAVFWDAGGTVHEIDTENRTKTTARAINDRGIIVGYTYGPDPGLGGGFPWTYDLNSQKFTELAVPADALDMLAVSINDNGDIVGTGTFPDVDPRNKNRPVIWANGTLTPRFLAPVPNHLFVFARDINNHGVIVGEDVGNAVIWDTASSQPRALPLPAPPPSKNPLFIVQASANSINDAGRIIGEAMAPTGIDTGVSFGVLWTGDHRPTSLDVGVHAVAINASGRVLGVKSGLGGGTLLLIDY